MADATMGKIQVSVEPVAEATSYNWYKDGVLQTSLHGEMAQISIPRNVCDVRYGINVEAINGCGTSTKIYKSVFVSCTDSYLVSPNPATDEVIVSVDQANIQNAHQTIDEVRIYDQQGTLKKKKKTGRVKSTSITISDLSNGIYWIEITGGHAERKQLLIQR